MDARSVCGRQLPEHCLIIVDLADCEDPSAYLEQVASLTCLETLVVGSQKFTDEHLSRLKRLTNLSRLVLDSTSVSDDGIGTLKQTLLKLAIYKSQRRKIIALEQIGGTVNTMLCRKLPKLRRRVGGEYFKHATKVFFMFNLVSDASLVHLEGLTNLRLLSLDHTKMTDAGLAHFKGHVNLQMLSLNGTQMTGAGNWRPRRASTLKRRWSSAAASRSPRFPLLRDRRPMTSLSSKLRPLY